jgi:hypothetical protein
LYENKEALIRMFTSKEWKSNKCSKLRDGIAIENWFRIKTIGRIF